MTYSLQRLLVIIGLIAVPFYELFFKVFPFVKVIAPDTRAPKELIAMLFALTIGLLAVFQGTLKPFKNKYLLAIPVFLLINLFMAPHVDLFINNVEMGDFYFWKPFATTLCFALMIAAIASWNTYLEDVLEVMAFCGLAMAGYVILQKIGLDQFWSQREGDQFIWVPGRSLGGNLGNPTVVAAFIAMLIPVSIYLRKYWMTAVMGIAVLLTQSEMAIVALIVVGFIAAVIFVESFQIPAMGIVIALIFCIVVWFTPIQKFVIEHSSGRVAVWAETLQDIRDGAVIDSKQDFSMTGVGFGRFSLLFPDKHKSIFQQAHNDPLEFAYDCGLIGLVLLLAGISVMLRDVLYSVSPYSQCFLFSFLIIFLISLGSFPFQLGAHQFYSAILVGLLHNDSIIGEGR